MPTTQRRAQADLIERLVRKPYRYNFFQAVRLLDLWLQRGAEAHGKTLGAVLRFKNSVALSFPPSQIEKVDVLSNAPEAGTPDSVAITAVGAQRSLRYIRVTPAFMGFLGVNGLLPYDYTATIAAQIAIQKNEGGRAFFDNFSHRSMLLFYRAWAKCRIECRGADDNFLDVQLSLAGVQRRPARLPAIAAAGAGATVLNKTLPDEVVARYAALIRHRPLQAEMLAGVLSDYFAVPVHCQPFVGAWASLAAGNRAALGLQNNVLGQDVMLGDRFSRRDAIVRLWLGPLTRAQFDSFLASGSAAKALKALLALFALPNVEFEIRPILRAADVQPASLDGRTPLGHASIVLTEPPTLDHDSTSYSVTFSPE